MTYVLATTPPPASRISPLGAFSLARKITAGIIYLRSSFSANSAGKRCSVILVLAVGAIEFVCMLYLAPSSFSVFIRPITPIFAAA